MNKLLLIILSLVLLGVIIGVIVYFVNRNKDPFFNKLETFGGGDSGIYKKPLIHT